MKDFIYDLETFSELNLKEVGAVKYFLHPSSAITFISYRFSAYDKVKYWSPYEGLTIPEDLEHVALNPHLYNFVAHNVEFDYLGWTIAFKKYFPQLLRPAISNITDNMALTNYYRVGSSLNAAAAMQNLNLRKYDVGKKVMMKLATPTRSGERYQPSKEEFEHFKIYGNLDTDILAMSFYSLPPLPTFERWVWEWTFRVNLQGIRVDVPLLKELNKIIENNMPGLEKRFFDIVGCSVRSPKAILFFRKYYPWVEDMRKDTVAELLMDTTPVPSEVREALDIKFLAGSTAIAKVKTALNMVVYDRVYGLFDYAKAQTKRFAGKGLQPQNFPRFDRTRLDAIDFDVNTEDLASIVREKAPTLKDPIGFVKNLLRRIWLPDFAGQWFYAGDFSKIEPTVLFWLLDMGPIPKQWYEELASKIYNIPLEEIDKEGPERQVGKGGQLSCGYGAGSKSFRVKLFQDTGILLTEEQAAKVVNTYRAMYPKVTKLWTELEVAFGNAINGQVSYLCGGRVVVCPMPGKWQGVMICLPSGNKLYYHGAGQKFITIRSEYYEIENGKKVKKTKTETKLSFFYKEADSNGNINSKIVYGGLLCENLVSATAREVMTPAMKRLEDHGYKVTGTVHDELWVLGPPGHEKEVERLMSITPDWAQGMSVTTEVQGGVRYLK